MYIVKVKIKPDLYAEYEVDEAVYTYIKQLENYINYPELSKLKELYPERFKILNLQVYYEMCCEECDEIVHNHFDCPICNSKYVGTECYFDLEDYYWFKEKYDCTLTCPECDAKFKLISSSPYNNGKWEHKVY